MLQLVRAATWLRKPASDQALVEVGRAVMGLAGAASVLFMFVLARQRLSRAWALGVALAVAVSPTLVVHAHYLDERTLLTTCLLAATVAFFRFVDRPAPAATLWLGVAMGLAWASHFAAILAGAVIRAGAAPGRHPAAQRAADAARRRVPGRGRCLPGSELDSSVGFARNP